MSSEQILSIGILVNSESTDECISVLSRILAEVDTKNHYNDLIEKSDNLSHLPEEEVRNLVLDLMDALDIYVPRNCYVGRKGNEIGIYYLKDKVESEKE